MSKNRMRPDESHTPHPLAENLQQPSLATPGESTGADTENAITQLSSACTVVETGGYRSPLEDLLRFWLLQTTILPNRGAGGEAGVLLRQ